MSKEIQIVPSARPVETEPKELGANLRIVNGEPYAFYNDENGAEVKTHLDNELPTIEEGDDGKVLGVVDGAYALTNGASGGMENPMTAAGDIIVGGTSGAPARLALGTAGQVLKVNDAGSALEYGSVSGGGDIIETNGLFAYDPISGGGSFQNVYDYFGITENGRYCFLCKEGSAFYIVTIGKGEHYNQMGISRISSGRIECTPVTNSGDYANKVEASLVPALIVAKPSSTDGSKTYTLKGQYVQGNFTTTWVEDTTN